MKFKNIITIILLIAAFEVFGQIGQGKQLEYGINYSPTITFNQKYERPPAFNSSIGLFAKHSIYRKLGMGIGFEYQKQKLNTTKWINCDPLGHPFFCVVPSQDEFELIRVPIWISFNMNFKPNSKIKADLIGGYAFGKLLDSSRKEDEYRLQGLIDNIHFGFVGIEFNSALYQKIKLTLGTHLEVTNIYNKRYGEIQNLKFVLRISR